MGERGIIMSAESVRGIMSGVKTQTRRVLKPGLQAAFDRAGEAILRRQPRQRGISWDEVKTLWVREAWCPKATEDGSHAPQSPNGCYFRADGVHVTLDDGDGFATVNADGSERSPWRSPIHMPRWASRLTLTVTDVRVERLQDISEADALAEGCSSFGPAPGDPHDGVPIGGAADAYAALWDSLHSPGAWARNPWVCAISFTAHAGATHGT